MTGCIRLAALCLLLFAAAPAGAADRHTINDGQTKTIDEHGICAQVTNNSGYVMMVPARTAEEWASFRNASNADATIASCEVVVAMAAGGSRISLQSLFSASDWSSNIEKRVILPAGNERGNSGSTAAAVYIGSDGWGGNLVFEVHGIISGKGGNANGGIGGDAFDANILGNSNQKINLVITGTVRAGGGGGGKGGNGGGGSGATTQYDPPNGTYAYGSISSPTGGATGGPGVYWRYMPQGPLSDILWDTTAPVVRVNGLPASVSHGGWTYQRGPLQVDSPYTRFYSIRRYKTVNTNTSGGVGGNGGHGQGYGQSRASGSDGANGGTSAGKGGTGGDGGTWGANGATGATGAAGNNGSGTLGTAGGIAGYAIQNYGNVTYSGSGTRQGRI